MNSREKLLKRLLDGFPVNKIKDWANHKGTKDEIIDYLYTIKEPTDILSFVALNFGQLHQSAYLFTINNEINIENVNFLNFVNIFSGSNGDFKEKIYYIEVALPYFNSRSDLRETLNFFVPVKILYFEKDIRIYIHTLSRNIKSYFNFDVFPTGNVNIEDNILKTISDAINQRLIPVDINKGVKHLWQNDEIDGRRIKSKRALSMKIEIMDEDNTFKSAYPEEFDDLMLIPLRKTIFRYRGEENIVSIFDINPSEGEIRIKRHSVGENDMDLLINLILENNA